MAAKLPPSAGPGYGLQRFHALELSREDLGVGCRELARPSLAHIGGRLPSPGDLALEKRDELRLSRDARSLGGDDQEAGRKEGGPEPSQGGGRLRPASRGPRSHPLRAT